MLKGERELSRVEVGRFRVIASGCTGLRSGLSGRWWCLFFSMKSPVSNDESLFGFACAGGRELELEARLDLRLQSRLSLDEKRDRDGFLQGREYLTKGRFFSFLC